MALPRPSNPLAAFADLKAFFATRQKHQWGFAAISVAIPTYFAVAFFTHHVEKDYVPPEVVFVQSYAPGRTIAEIRAQQKIDQATRKLENAELEARRQKRMAQARELEKQMDALGL
jgi:cobalamin biosynthesis protein CobD/CbiB